MLKIDSCLIIKNEQDNINFLINQLLIFSHEIHITDTGSTDKTISILEKLKSEHDNIFIHHYKWDFNFSNARNYSLHYDNDTSDYKFWCDGDDTLNDKLISTLQQISNQNDSDIDIYYIKYQYYQGDKNPHFRTSILKTSADLKWNDPIHEYIGLFNGIKLNYNYFNNGSLLIHHRKDVHTNRNLEIFQNMEKIGYNFIGRNYYYYAIELLNNGLKKSAYEMFKECIYYKDNYDEQDKFNSLINIYNIKHDKEWIEMFYYVLSLNIYRGDILYYAGNYYLEVEKNYFLAKLFYKGALEYKYDNTCAFGLLNENITINPLLQLGLISWYENNPEETKYYNDQVLKYDPNNQTAIDNIKFINNQYKEGK